MAEIRRYEDIMQSAVANMAANQDKITDFNSGSAIHTILDTVARIAERMYVAIRQGYNDNLRLVPYLLFKFERKPGQYANGAVQFQRASPGASQTTIPSGTRVSGNGKTFITTATGYVAPGALHSNDIPVIAELAGAAYNMPENTIDAIETAVPTDIAAVANSAPMTGGADAETDSVFDERFKIFLNGLSGTSDYAIMSAALGLDAVRSVSLKNHKPPLRNIYNMSVYVDDGSGSATEETLEAVRLEVEGDGTEQHQGHLAPGVNVRIVPPLTVPVDFPDVAVDVYRADLSTAEEEVRSVLAEYVNSLTIGKSVIISEAIARIMKLAYVRDCKIPQENVELQSDQIARFGSAAIEIRELSNG